MSRIFLAFFAVVACSHFCLGDNEEFKEQVKKFVEECRNQHNLKPGEIQDAVKSMKVPESENGECFLSCMMKKLDLLKDGKLNVERGLEMNKLKFTDPADLEKANGIVKLCAEEKAVEGECKMAAQIAKCVLTNAIKNNLKLPNEGF